MTVPNKVARRPAPHRPLPTTARARGDKPDTPVRRYLAIAEAIAIDIAEGRVAAGQALPNDRLLCARFGVSRTVIREAIQHLRTRRVLRVRHGSGSYATPPGEWDLQDPMLLAVALSGSAVGQLVRDLMDVRRMVEPEACALAAERATAEDIATLHAIFARMLTVRDDLDQYLALHEDFHRRIITASGNAIVLALADQIAALQLAVQRRYFAWRHAHVPGAAQRQAPGDGNAHEILLQAITERRPDRARTAMQAHIQSLERMAEQLFPICRGPA